MVRLWMFWEEWLHSSGKFICCQAFYLLWGRQQKYGIRVAKSSAWNVRLFCRMKSWDGFNFSNVLPKFSVLTALVQMNVGWYILSCGAVVGLNMTSYPVTRENVGKVSFCKTLIQVETLSFFLLHFYVALRLKNYIFILSQHCAYALVRFRHINHLHFKS